MAVHGTRIGAAACLHGMRSYGLCLAVRADPIAVTAEAPDRRPVRHSGRRHDIIQRFEVSRTIDNAAVEHGQVARDLGDLAFGAGKKSRSGTIMSANCPTWIRPFLPSSFENQVTFSVHILSAVSRSRQLRCG
jgi:hypothetical protein